MQVRAEWVLTLGLTSVCFKSSAFMGMLDGHCWKSSGVATIPSCDILCVTFPSDEFKSSEAFIEVRDFAKEVSGDATLLSNWSSGEEGERTSKKLVACIGGAFSYIYRHKPEFIFVENIEAFAPFLPFLEMIATQLGYAWSHIKLDSSNVGVVCPKSSVVSFGRRDHSGSGAKDFGTLVQSSVNVLVEAHKIFSNIPLSIFLGSDADAFQAHGVGAAIRVDTSTDWMSTHDYIFQVSGFGRPDKAAMNHFIKKIQATGMRSMFAKTTQRMQEVAYWACKTMEKQANTSEGVVVDLAVPLNKITIFDIYEKDWDNKNNYYISRCAAAQTRRRART